jgi:DNA-binding CsgD family transcriptional regulator
MRKAAESLEAVPFLPDATRLRRQLAGRLVETGDKKAASVELRRAFGVFVRLRANLEIERVKEQFREIGERPPTQIVATDGLLGLTPKETAVALSTAAGKSASATARELKMKSRTVTTHLTSIYRKLGVSGRAELRDVIRRAELKGQLD